MEEIKRIDRVCEYNKYVGLDTVHPLVTVVNLDKVDNVRRFKQYLNLYAVFLKDKHCGAMNYGGQPYDYEDGTLVFVAPGQVYGVDSDTETKPSGYALLFHPDLIRGTQIEKNIRNYSFFYYEVREALHLSVKERDIIIECFEKISTEMQQNIDKHSQTLIVTYIELLLNYCIRFYDRQFITRSHSNRDILIRFEKLLNDYFQSDDAQIYGIPSVNWCAERLFLSTNYFGDLVKKETGSTALDYIQTRIINEAKSKIYDSSKTIGEVASELGFKYPHHFTRLFKQKVGLTPMEFRNLN